MKKLFMAFLLTLFVNLSFSQLDSLVANYQFTTESQISTYDSNLVDNKLVVNLHMNEVDYLGKVTIDLLDFETEIPFLKVIKTKEQIISDPTSFINNQNIAISLGYFDIARPYKIKITVQTYSTSFLPQIELTHQP